MPRIDQTEVQLAAAGDGRVADFVDDWQRCQDMEADPPDQASFPPGLRRCIDQFGQGCQWTDFPALTTITP